MLTGTPFVRTRHILTVTSIMFMPSWLEAMKQVGRSLELGDIQRNFQPMCREACVKQRLRY